LPASGDVFDGRDELGNTQFVAGERYHASDIARGILQRTGSEATNVRCRDQLNALTVTQSNSEQAKHHTAHSGVNGECVHKADPPQDRGGQAKLANVTLDGPFALVVRQPALAFNAFG
jgi:hypothetical protein